VPKGSIVDAVAAIFPKSNRLSSTAMHILDSPIWNALHSVHASFGEGNALARRYRPNIGPLAATRDHSAGVGQGPVVQ